MNKAAEKNIIVAASIAVAMIGGSLVANDTRSVEHNRSEREERINWQKGEADILTGVSFDEFGPALTMSTLDRKHLLPFWNTPDLNGRLNLTEEQRNDLTRSFVETTRRIEAANIDSTEAIASLREELAKDDPSISEVEDLSDELSSAMKARQGAIFAHTALVKRTLNAEQETNLLARTQPPGIPNRTGEYLRIVIPAAPMGGQPNLVGRSESSAPMISIGGGYEGYNPNTHTYTSRYGQVAQPSTETPTPTPTPSGEESPTPTPVWGDSTDTPTPTPTWEGTSTATRTPGPLN